MASVGYNVDVDLPGTPAAFTTEAMTDLGSNVWQITDTSKRVWSPTATITASTGTISTVDRLFGTITFTGVVVAPTCTGTYLPMTSIASARGYSRSLRGQNEDSTTLIQGAASTAFMSRLPVVKDCSATIDRLQNWDEYFQDEFVADTQVVLSFYELYSGTPDCAMWAYISEVTNSGDWDSLVIEQIQFAGAADANGRSFSFGP
jgi:hypothetical protein